MKEKYEILNNAIIDSQANICGIWLEVEGILFILYDNESLKLLKKMINIICLTKRTS